MPKAKKQRDFEYFDVRRRQRFEGGQWRAIPREQSINLMCFLLRGISYQELYGDPVVRVNGKHVFDRLIKNAKGLPMELQVDADGNAHDMTAEFTTPKKTGIFDKAKLAIDKYNRQHNSDGAKSLILGELFTCARKDPPTTPLEQLKNDVVDALDKINDKGRELRHFCAPFVGIQLGRAPLVKEEKFEDFMNYFADKNIEYFYTNGGTTAEKKAAARARKAGILSEVKSYDKVNRKGGPSIMVRGDGNGKHCVNGTCCNSDSDDTWCETVIVNGNATCALGSDHGTQCY